MNYLIFFLLTLTNMRIVHSQQIPIGTNTIIVKNVSFQSVLTSLIKLQYQIDKTDRDKSYVQTKYKDVPGTITHLALFVQISGENTIIKGMWWTNLARPKNDANTNLIMIVQKTNSLGINMIFDEMNNFASSLKGKITYAKQ